MGISICKFCVRGRLASAPKVIHQLDKDGVEYVSATVRISIPRVKLDENGISKRCGYNVVSVAVHGNSSRTNRAGRRGSLPPLAQGRPCRNQRLLFNT